METKTMNKTINEQALGYVISKDRYLGDGRIAMREKKAYTAGVEAIRSILASRLDRLLWKAEKSNTDYDKARLDGALWLYEVLEEED
jgi:retron-type reverse transcriptase